MRTLIIRPLSAFAVAVTILVFAPGHAAAQIDARVDQRAIMRRPIPAAALRGSVDFARTELFFGTAKADGTVVTDEDFNAFIDEIVTPRFPDGLTLLRADGQFRGENGVIVKEASFVLILLYPVEGFRESSRKINVIRERYKDAFLQESVLRVDDPFAVRVSF
jgi:hypothetical protein